MSVKYIPTGNQFISLPKVCEEDASIEDYTFLHMGYKGLIDVRGTKDKPLIQPNFKINGIEQHLSNLKWDRLRYWVPTFSCQKDGVDLQGTFMAPIDERGFVIRLEVANETEEPVKLTYGIRGCWASTWHCVNEDKQLEGKKYIYRSNWNHGVVFDMRCGYPMFAFAPMSDKETEVHFSKRGSAVEYSIERIERLAPGDRTALTLYWGVGFEEVAAATSAKEMLRHGYECNLRRTLEWLDARTQVFQDEKLNTLYNTNLFFCIFFSTGTTLDTEEFVLMTSRSPRYYVSAAYWDRDSMLWSFPAILDVDGSLAKNMLKYVFGRQRRNIGVHSRYIDGTILEPGFELDELMAPILAIEQYTKATGDDSILYEPDVLCGVAEILEKLKLRRHPEVSLFSTFLQPTDDLIVHPYLTYDNVLVWKGLRAIADLWPQKYASVSAEADAVREAIQTHCIKEMDGKKYYAWSVDLEEHHDVYDEPPGSLQLLAYLGFCKTSDEVYQNTVAMIRSSKYKYSFAGCEFAEIGCPHAPHPWILSVANSLLCGRCEEASNFLRRVKMDNFIACESVDENTGYSTTGEAFATCAGFLCHAMTTARDIINKSIKIVDA